MNNDWKLLQLIDSASPTGAFSHSFGMETAAKEGKLRSKEALYEWITVFLEGSLVPTEGKGVYLAQALGASFRNEEMTDRQFEKAIQKLDQRLFFSKVPYEGREASRKIGKRFLKNVITLYPEAGLQKYDSWIRDGRCYGNSAIVHGWITDYLEVDSKHSVFTYLYTTINNLLQSAIRLNLIGQTDAQLILRDLNPDLQSFAKEVIEEAPSSIEDLYTFSIAQEIESMRHETLYSRLFMS